MSAAHSGQLGAARGYTFHVIRSPQMIIIAATG
jgi:hypothetical protein